VEEFKMVEEFTGGIQSRLRVQWKNPKYVKSSVGNLKKQKNCSEKQVKAGKDFS
jgi:hypothetical protein